jgi:lysophospholipase L1-like esterase
MKTILCYGDSLTYGTKPDDSGRHDFEDRWPTVLGEGLGTDKVRIIAEGLGGRTTVFDDYSAIADRNGVRILPTILASHSPLDCIVIMLGTNDLKTYLSGSAFGAAMGLKRMVEIIRTYPYDVDAHVPEIVVVSPPHCVPTVHADLSPMFTHGLSESYEFASHYQRVAEELECGFFDASTVAVASPLDGVHLDAEDSRAIGMALVPVVAKVLGLQA